MKKIFAGFLLVLSILTGTTSTDMATILLSVAGAVVGLLLLSSKKILKRV